VFNKGFMTSVVRPASKVYRRVVVKPVRTGLGNMGKNLTFRAGNCNHCKYIPLLLDLVAAAMRAGQGLPEAHSPAGTSWARRLLLSHLAGLEEPVQRYLRAAAVLGRRFRPEVAAQVMFEDHYPPVKIKFPNGVNGLPRLTYWQPIGYRPLTLDIYLPPAGLPRPAAGFPLIVHIHGGAWLNGESRFGAPFVDFPGVLASLAARGYVVASIDYRLSGEAAFPAAYVAQVRNGLRPAANIVINIASREPLISHPGIVTLGKTRRLCNMANLTATCPELAPSGWHLYVAYAVPIPALGDFDSDAEVELALADLREQFPNFVQAKILSTRVMRDDWPAQRSCAGYDLPRETGIEGLWCVGDAVKQYGNGGTQACAETAKIVTDAILAERARIPKASRI